MRTYADAPSGRSLDAGPTRWDGACSMPRLACQLILPILFSSALWISDERIEMTDWELQDFAVQVVRDQLEKTGKRLLL